MLNQKMKWNLNPCGNFWTKDSSKFGQKILEKFGWTPGKGLGVNEQGIVAPIRLKCNSTQKGLGYERGGKADLFQHQEEFNSILTSLNSVNNSSDQIDGAEKQISLEEKSKNCKTRVHYHKFTRGKDLSRYSEKDLSCILGVFSSLKQTEPSQEINGTLNENIDTFSNNCTVNDIGVKLDEEQSTNRNVKVKSKKRNRKRKHVETDEDNAEMSNDSPISNFQCLIGNEEQIEIVNDQTKDVKSRRKKKKFEDTSINHRLMSNNCDKSLDKCHVIVNDIEKPKRKKKKHK